MVEKRGDFGFTQFGRMAFAVKINKMPDPVDVALLGARALMLALDRIPHLLQQPWFGRSRTLIAVIPTVITPGLIDFPIIRSTR